MSKTNRALSIASGFGLTPIAPNEGPLAEVRDTKGNTLTVRTVENRLRFQLKSDERVYRADAAAHDEQSSWPFLHRSSSIQAAPRRSGRRYIGHSEILDASDDLVAAMTPHERSPLSAAGRTIEGEIGAA